MLQVARKWSGHFLRFQKGRISEGGLLDMPPRAVAVFFYSAVDAMSRRTPRLVGQIENDLWVLT
jgi:hypothetical protein